MTIIGFYIVFGVILWYVVGLSAGLWFIWTNKWHPKTITLGDLVIAHITSILGPINLFCIGVVVFVNSTWCDVVIYPWKNKGDEK